MSGMTSIYVPSAGADDWRWLLAQPGLHWKHGASAMALADAWEAANPWPPKVARALEAGGFAGLELLVALPEHKVPLPGGSTASQTDLFVLARRPTGSLVAIAVEGKAEEAFGNRTVAQWRAQGGAGREKRLAYLLGVLGLSDDAHTGELWYQLLHRTASAIIEAERFGAQDAIMLVHSFSKVGARFDEYAAFASALGVRAAPDTIAAGRAHGATRLHLGWVHDTPAPALAEASVGQRFDRAVAFARDLHTEQVRAGTGIPYLAHLLAVASLVLEDGGSEDEAIAALLHDAVEDQGGHPTLRRVEQQFGRNVARIVAACSDSDVTPKPPWRERKEAYVAHLHDPKLPAGALRVSLADKLHNARAILFDLRAGHEVSSRFRVGRDEQLWYYDAVAITFTELSDSPMAAELRRVVDELLECS
jgi:hypothetical protein